MARYADPQALIDAQRVALERLPKKAAAAHLKMMQTVQKRVKAELLSGTTTSADLRRMGHPFGRRTSRRGYKREVLKGGYRLSSRGDRKGTHHRLRNVGIAVPKLPINKQKGALADSAKILRIAQPGGGQELRLAYTAPYAPYILGPGGTRKMVGRGFMPAKARIDREENREYLYQLRTLILTNAAARA